MRSLAIDRSLKQSLVSSQRAWTFRFSFTQLFSSVLALFFLFLSLSLSHYFSPLSLVACTCFFTNFDMLMMHPASGLSPLTRSEGMTMNVESDRRAHCCSLLNDLYSFFLGVRVLLVYKHL